MSRCLALALFVASAAGFHAVPGLRTLTQASQASRIMMSSYEEYVMSRQCATAVQVAAPAAAVSGYEEYMMSRQGQVEAPATPPASIAPKVPVVNVVTTNSAATIAAYEEYMMSRQGATAVEIAPPAPVEVAPPAAAMSAYEEYMMSRQGQVEAPATPLAPEAPVMPTNPIASVANAAANYDPWMDDEKTVVTFMVDGRPKKYRITH